MEAYIGQIIIFAGNYPPLGWLTCDGRTLNISDYNNLYSVIGTQYGGNGTTTFNLPDYRGRVPVHSGQGTGLTNRKTGDKFGSEINQLNINQLPLHNHNFTGTINVSSEIATTVVAIGNYYALAKKLVGPSQWVGYNLYSRESNTESNECVSGTTSNAGDSSPVNNIQPSFVMNFIICNQGVKPPNT